MVKDIFLSDFAKNKKMEIFQIFDQNHGLTPLEKSQFLTVLTFCFFIVLKSFFHFWNIVKHILLADFDNDKKMEKFQIFDQKPWTNPFRKIPIFDFFNFLFFIV